jgi:hypothetical protein
MGVGENTIYWLYRTDNCDKLTLQQKSHLYIPRKGIARLSPNFRIHVSVSDLYIPKIGPHIFLQQNRKTDCGNI